MICNKPLISGEEGWEKKPNWRGEIYLIPMLQHLENFRDSIVKTWRFFLLRKLR